MFDSFNRPINYLRISITDRCNLRCVYCMPPEGIPVKHHSEILRFEEIVSVVQEAVNLGISKIRITGGEPLVRKGVEDLIAMIAQVPGISDLGLTTNGILLEPYARKLKEAGLHRVNVSLDAIDPARYREITRGGDVQQVLRGIEAALKHGLTPVKINCVVQDHSAGPDAMAVKAYGDKHGIQVRFIHQMTLHEGCFTTVEGGDGGNCKVCSRLRLTSDGKIKPCLFSDLSYDIHPLLEGKRLPATPNSIREALIQAIQNKPERGTLNTTGSFHNIGG